ncbi:hypothetical protein DENSPDRAFT_553881 [Dentipellis sp. KUC8613]|nr:hypothetical protein DENSPDRAFT_553881 [Dentipellis sp. KUC8613]
MCMIATVHRRQRAFLLVIIHYRLCATAHRAPCTVPCSHPNPLELERKLELELELELERKLVATDKLIVFPPPPHPVLRTRARPSVLVFAAQRRTRQADKERSGDWPRPTPDNRQSTPENENGNGNENEKTLIKSSMVNEIGPRGRGGEEGRTVWVCSGGGAGDPDAYSDSDSGFGAAGPSVGPR